MYMAINDKAEMLKLPEVTLLSAHRYKLRKI